MSETPLPILGLTMGDAAGIGPEIVVRALSEERVFRICRPLVLGDTGALKRAAEPLKLSLNLNILEQNRDPAGELGTIDLLPISRLEEAHLTPGQPNAQTGKASAEYITAGAHLALAGKIQGLVTAPISKLALNLAGHKFQGHTEMLAHLAGGVKVVMMLAGPRLKVILVTTHIALKDVPVLLTAEQIVSTAEITRDSFKKFFGIPHPRLAVAGLNPHAGEGGLFGNEEEEIIQPAVDKAKKRGLDLTGPIPPDTVFYRAVNREFDAVVCMYHDQALIPFKLLHFKDGVNVTLGLPFIRTSVDHGTACDIAGKGRADHTSLLAAIEMAVSMHTTLRRMTIDLK